MRAAFALVLVAGLGAAAAAEARPASVAKHRKRIVAALERAAPQQAEACGGFDPAKLAASARWTAITTKPAGWRAPASGHLPDRNRSVAGEVTIEWDESPRAGAPAWGYVTVAGGQGGREVRAAIPARGAPSTRSREVIALRGTTLVVWGGIDDQGRARGDGASFDFRTARWKRLATKGAPSGRAHATAAWLGERLFVWGGGRPTQAGVLSPGGLGEVEFLTDGAILDVKKNRWTPVTAVGAPSGRRNARTFARDGVVVMFGGHGAWEWSYEGGHAVDDLAIYRASDDRWTRVPVSFWEQPFAQAIAALPGGWYATYSVEKGLFLLDPAAGVLHPVKLPAGGEKLTYAELVPTCDGLVLFGGQRMVHPGGGCENFTGPGGCDPVGPRWAKNSAGWVLGF